MMPLNKYDIKTSPLHNTFLWGSELYFWVERVSVCHSKTLKKKSIGVKILLYHKHASESKNYSLFTLALVLAKFFYCVKLCTEEIFGLLFVWITLETNSWNRVNKIYYNNKDTFLISLKILDKIIVHSRKPRF